jgi:hypothetical protein
MLEVKWLWDEADHSPSFTAAVKNVESYAYTSSYVFKVWCLIEYRDNFTLL